ncbi:hypothetical protein BD413DRAFT_482022 [Trametes elegans]|nr:hypothetical protein BD413DRAFT_482022 [Trametes elegans]
MSTCRRDGLTTPVDPQTPETTNVTEQQVPPSDRTREALTNIPQRQHGRVTSRASNTASERDQESAHSPQPALRKSNTRTPSYTRKRHANPQRLAQPFGKENTPSPPRASPKAPSPLARGGAGPGFATPMCARSLAGHLLEREKLQEPPSPALSTELSPVTQGMMQDLRKQRMRARQAERRRGIWVRDRE